MMKEKAENGLEQNLSVMQAMSGLTSLSARINEICGRTHLPDYSSIQTVIKGSALWGTVKPKWTAMDVAVLNSPGIAALAALEAQTSKLALNSAIAPLTSVATQLSTISDALASQTDFVKQLIAPASMLSDLQRVAELTHKSIAEAGKLNSWPLGVLDSVSLMVDRQVDWASKFSSTAYSDFPFPLTENVNDLYPKVNVIEVLPEELEYEKTQQEDISANDALERTPAFRFSERGKALIERVVTINNICKRKQINPIFTFSEATMMAAVTLGGTECVNRASLGDVIDSLYFIFYENLDHIKALVTDETVRKEEVYQCIFRLKHIRTDFRHDNEHGGSSKINAKIKNIGESYAHYTGKVALTSKKDFQTAQKKLFDEFDELANHLIERIES